ncbi:MAG: DegT/DnrJ/EryC1/StrS family aminotransferase [Rhodospirillales bacterium]|nr:DegT/DnrJ/EryC1/StrS family aminotransferase [Rhodospirillales bacterium]
MPVPFVDLKLHHSTLKQEILDAVSRILDSGTFILGPEVEGFEQDFATYLGVKHVVAVNSGTSALELALRAIGIGPGDEVITTTMTFVATVTAIVATGAKPVLADVTQNEWTLDPDGFEKAITPRTKAVIPVHLHGRPANMQAISRIARQAGIAVIEDAAQAHGATIGTQMAGTLGVMGCFSFYPAKNLGACGEGGAIATNDDELAEKLRLLRDWGQSQRYRHDMPGCGNFRMDAIQGAILTLKLRRLDAWLAARRRLAEKYLMALDGTVGLPLSHPGHAWHVFSIRAKNRDRLRHFLQDRHIASGCHYPIPAHLQPMFASLALKAGDFPVSESLVDEFLSLPLFPEMTDQQCETVIDAIKAYK